METSPLTKELYSIDWAARFDQYQKFEKLNYSDLNTLLSKIEETIEKNLSNKKGLDNLETLRARLKDTKSNSPEWHHLSMLVNLHVIKTAIPKGLTASATFSAIQIMGHMWKSLASESGSAKPAPGKAPTRQKVTQKAKATSTANRTKSTSKAETTKTKKATTAKSSTSKTATKSNKRKENTVTENVVIKNLTAEAGAEDDKPLAVKCHEVANSLADEYPQYTLTAIRVMTAEKLGVTRQYVENLDIKPARFK